MLKLDKNILSFLQIKSFYIKEDFSDKLILCIPLKLEKDFFLMFFSDNTKSESGVLKILMENNSYITIKCTFKKMDEKAKRYAVFVAEPLPPSLSEKIKKLESNNAFTEKRSGQRFILTDKNYKTFGLKSRNCPIVISGIELTASLDDISMHGMRISFQTSSRLASSLFSNNFSSLLLSLMGIKLSFINPVLSIFLILLPSRVHSFSKNTNSISIGCKIKEPYSLEYTKRIIDFVNELEKNYVLEQSISR